MIKNIHLIISGILLVPIAFGYGFGHVRFDIFVFEVDSVDLQNIFKAIMGLYLALAAFWLYGAYCKDFWKAATISNILFMLGLAVGRTVSIVLDGIPSNLWLLGTFGEYFLGAFALFQYRKYTKKATL